jgi:hypothetical protein
MCSLGGAINVFGIHELAFHYGEAMQQMYFPICAKGKNLIPLHKEHMRLIVWSKQCHAMDGFCELFKKMVTHGDDPLINKCTCKEVSLEKAVDWIGKYAQSPVCGYEGEHRLGTAHRRRPPSSRKYIDDLYKVPCYRWRMKERDVLVTEQPLSSYLLACGHGVLVKEIVTSHSQWQQMLHCS